MSAKVPQAEKSGLTKDQNAPPSRSLTPSIALHMRTNTTEIDSTINHPGSVKINVKGAFIVDQDPLSLSGAINSTCHDTKDIRLPNHTAVVSHIAVDVCFLPYIFGRNLCVWLYILIDPLLIAILDWRFLGQTRLLFSRTTFQRARWAPELHELRDRADRRLRGFYEGAEGEAAEAQWIKTRGALRYGDWRWSI